MAVMWGGGLEIGVTESLQSNTVLNQWSDENREVLLLCSNKADDLYIAIHTAYINLEV